MKTTKELRAEMLADHARNDDCNCSSCEFMRNIIADANELEDGLASLRSLHAERFVELLRRVSLSEYETLQKRCDSLDAELAVSREVSSQQTRTILGQTEELRVLRSQHAAEVMEHVSLSEHEALQKRCDSLRAELDRREAHSLAGAIQQIRNTIIHGDHKFGLAFGRLGLLALTSAYALDQPVTEDEAAAALGETETRKQAGEVDAVAPVAAEVESPNPSASAPSGPNREGEQVTAASVSESPKPAFHHPNPEAIWTGDEDGFSNYAKVALNGGLKCDYMDGVVEAYWLDAPKWLNNIGPAGIAARRAIAWATAKEQPDKWLTYCIHGTPIPDEGEPGYCEKCMASNMGKEQPEPPTTTTGNSGEKCPACGAEESDEDRVGNMRRFKCGSASALWQRKDQDWVVVASDRPDFAADNYWELQAKPILAERNAAIIELGGITIEASAPAKSEPTTTWPPSWLAATAAEAPKTPTQCDYVTPNGSDGCLNCGLAPGHQGRHATVYEVTGGGADNPSLEWMTKSLWDAIQATKPPSYSTSHAKTKQQEPAPAKSPVDCTPPNINPQSDCDCEAHQQARDAAGMPRLVTPFEPAPVKSYIYLASPYSHADKAMMESRFQAVCRTAARMMSDGESVFSPIIHNHPIAVAGGLQTGWDFWKNYDETMIGHASKLVVLGLNGWEESVGVLAEIEIAKSIGIPVEYLYDENCDAYRKHEPAKREAFEKLKGCPLGLAISNGYLLDAVLELIRCEESR